MRGNNVVGLLFSNVHEERVRELTEKRAMASVPFGGRYRLIDFPLSNMVNCGINKVGVMTKSNYQSLMDHLGSGKAWDLSRKREGLYMLPPFGAQSSISNSRIDSLTAAFRFLSSSKEEYVLLSDCDTVANIDLKKVIAAHMEKQADITIVYRYGKIPPKISSVGVLQLDPEFRVRDMLIDPRIEGECNYSMNIILIGRQLLMKLVEDCVSRNLYDFPRDLLQRNIPHYRVYAHEFTGFMQVISSMNSYFEANMALMLPQVRSQLFCPDRPIYTKVRDDMPARYGLGCHVSNSLIADGCQVDGEVHNCVLFRGVKVGKGAKLENCVIMQDSIIGRDSHLNYVVIDKDVEIKQERTLMGFQSYPVFISKGSTV